MMTRSEKIAANKARKQVDAAFSRNCKGVQIPILEISGIFKAGQAALAAGTDLDAAVKAAIAAVALKPGDDEGMTFTVATA